MNQHWYKRANIATLILLWTSCSWPVFSLGSMATAQPALARVPRTTPFRSSQGKFAIAFPRPPKLQKSQDSNGHTIHNFITQERGRSYLVSYFDQPNLKNLSPSTIQSRLLKIVSGFTTGAELKVTYAKPVRLGKYPGREFDFIGTGSAGKGRTYVVGNRVYLLVGVDRGRSVAAFLNSFRLL